MLRCPLPDQGRTADVKNAGTARDTQGTLKEFHPAGAEVSKGALQKGRVGHVRWLATIMIAVLIGCSSKKEHGRSAAEAAPAPKLVLSRSPPATEEEPEEYTIVVAHHVVFHESSGIDLRAEWLQGRLYPTRKGIPPSLDDASSFKVTVEEGRTEISMRGLTTALIQATSRQSTLTNIRLSSAGPQKIRINATLHKVVALPVQIDGDIDATADGRIRIKVTGLKVIKMPMKGLLRLLSIRPADLVHVESAKGIEMNGDEVYLRTDALLPAPHKSGHLTDVHFTGEGNLEERYGRHNTELPSPDNWNPGPLHNFMRLSGGTIRFGKLTMNPTDLVLIDTSPGDWFHFDLLRYQSQLVRGNMQMTESGGLRVFVPDSTKVPKAGTAARPEPHR